MTTAETTPEQNDNSVAARIDDAFVNSLTEFISDEVAQDDDPIDESTDLLLTGQVDSLGVVRIVLWIEQSLGIEIDPLDVVLENFQTIGQMAAYLRQR
ncbi:MAG: acyl carrier protein [Candidatus Azotimanducaceae bacterium]